MGFAVSDSWSRQSNAFERSVKFGVKLQKIDLIDKNTWPYCFSQKNSDYCAKISEIKGKYLTISDYNKFTNDMLETKIKQKELVNKSNIFNDLRISD